MKKAKQWRGCENITFTFNGGWSDPDINYNGYVFNYWDIENALWDMFLEETGHKDSEAYDPDVESEFNGYVQLNGEGYLEDVIAGGYFENESKSWRK